jgi:hypothetical protein
MIRRAYSDFHSATLKALARAGSNVSSRTPPRIVVVGGIFCCAKTSHISLATRPTIADLLCYRHGGDLQALLPIAKSLYNNFAYTLKTDRARELFSERVPAYGNPGHVAAATAVSVGRILPGSRFNLIDYSSIRANGMHHSRRAGHAREL